MKRKGWTAISLALLLCCVTWRSGLAQGTSGALSTTLILEKQDGERRLHRAAGNKMGTAPFILKVDPKNTGSQHLILFTEDLAPGASIPAHKHPEAEEIVVLQSGRSRVHLGSTVREVGPGAIVFIPAGTWISIDNAGTEPVSLIAIFSKPGFEEYLRAISVRDGDVNTPLSKEELDAIRAEHPHAVSYK